MEMEAHFEILGPVRVRIEDREALVTGRERILLPMLLLHVNDWVPWERLVDAIWGDRPPRNARNQVHGCVSRLRKRLAAAGMPAALVATGPAGYGIRVDPRLVDACEFRRLVGQARVAAADGRLAQARDRHREALLLWRGPALAGVDSDLVRQSAAALDEERVRAYEECIDIELQLGAAGELVPELTELVAAHPFRENLHAALMQALDRAGRHADALAAYQTVRTALRDELGTEPGPKLRRTHRAILHRGRGADVAPDEQAPHPSPVPRELPAEASCFVGRGSELVRLRAALTPAVPASRRRPAVAVVYGPGGVEKSALVVRAGHELAAAYPDGQLYVDLFGSTPGMRALPAAETLGRVLRSLGVHPSEIPASDHAAAALLRGVTADRRLLLVLDNVADRDQVAPLVPSGPGCGVLVTCRHPLATVDADFRLRLAPLPGPDALVLLARLTGDRDLDAGAAQRIVGYGEGLPLAVRVAGARLASRPDLSEGEYADRLADDSRRLDELQVDDLAVRACIRTGYEALPGRPGGERAARAFRAIGLLHVPDVAAGVIAAMLGEQAVATARAALDMLVDAQLLEPVAGGRYRLHDLVRLVAAERVADEDSPAERGEAFHRAIAYYTATLFRVDTMLDADRSRPYEKFSIPAGVPVPLLTELAEARQWLDDELPSLRSVIDQAVAGPDDVWQLCKWLSDSLWCRLDVRGEWQAAHRVSQSLLECAERCGDPEVAATGFLVHGRSEACLGRYDSALTYLDRALRAWRDLGNPHGAALSLNGLGIVETRMGQVEPSLRHYHEALECLRTSRTEADDRLAAVLLSNLSISHTLLGELDEAARAGEESMAVSAEYGLATPTFVLPNLAVVHCLRGDQATAVQYLDQAIVQATECGERVSMCTALLLRSEVRRRCGRLAEAAADADEALSLAGNWRYRIAMAAAYRQRSKILATMGDDVGAVHVQALADKAYSEVAGHLRVPLIELLLA